MENKEFIKFIEKYEINLNEINNLKILYKNSKFMIKIFDDIKKNGIIGLKKEEQILIYNLHKKGII